MPVAAAGELDQRVTIQQKTLVADTQGGRAQTPATVDEVWASVKPLSGVERMQAQAIGSHISWRVTMRYRADVTPQMKVLWTPYRATAAKTFEIRSLLVQDDMLILDCGEVL